MTVTNPAPTALPPRVIPGTIAVELEHSGEEAERDPFGHEVVTLPTSS